jgi:hypothetical protein
MKLQYIVKRGKNVGMVLTPHRFEDGKFLAHKTNSRNDPDGKRVSSEHELADLVRLGYHVRMSNAAAFLKKQADDSDLTASVKNILRSTPRKLAKGPKANPLAILQTFEASAQKILAPHRFVSKLQAMNLPAEIVTLLDDLTVVLGTGAKAWAVVLQWLAERLSDQFTLSRQSERLLRQVLKDEDTKMLHELKLTWSAKIDAFVNQEFESASNENFELPEFLRKQAD